MTLFETYPLDEWKLVYRVLHGQLSKHLDLLDSDFLQALQDFLQKQAQAAGVDPTDHGQWDTWLGNVPVSCEERVAERQILHD